MIERARVKGARVSPERRGDGCTAEDLVEPLIDLVGG